jgi:predicted nucleic acid-binding protein
MIFVDTSFFIALLDPHDANHPRAVEAFHAFQGSRLSDLLLTTNNVVLETITVARYEVGHALAVRAGQLLYDGRLARLHRTTAEEEAAYFAYLEKHADKEYSAVDCLRFALMEKLGIHEALAFDSDFGHRFVMRPAPQAR